MKISIVCVGRLKEKYLSDAVAEYTKRLSRYAKTEVIEVADERAPENLSEADMQNVKRREGERILKAIGKDAYVAALAIDGKKLSSEGFAGVIEAGGANIAFVIGGSLGLSDEVLEAADIKISFSDMTFPHQLMRVILTEQIYRAFKIIKNEPYHK